MSAFFTSWYVGRETVTEVEVGNNTGVGKFFANAVRTISEVSVSGWAIFSMIGVAVKGLGVTLDSIDRTLGVIGVSAGKQP